MTKRAKIEQHHPSDSLDTSPPSSTTASQNPHARQRLLTNEEDVWRENAWDHAPWTEEREAAALAIIERQHRESPHLNPNIPAKDTKQPGNVVDPEDLHRGSRQWNSFYDQHERMFFKDRQWLSGEFPELFELSMGEEEKVIFEIGCGVGNTLLPILKHYRDKGKEGEEQCCKVKLVGCDISESAINLLKVR